MNAVIEKKQDSINGILKSALSSPLFYFNLVISSATLFLLPILLGFASNIGTLITMFFAFSLVIISAVAAKESKWSATLVLICSLTFLLLLRANSSPTDGVWTSFYTEKEVENFKQIKQLKVSFEEIKDTLNKSSLKSQLSLFNISDKSTYSNLKNPFGADITVVDGNEIEITLSDIDEEAVHVVMAKYEPDALYELSKDKLVGMVRYYVNDNGTYNLTIAFERGEITPDDLSGKF